MKKIEASITLVFFNGVYSEQASDTQLLPKNSVQFAAQTNGITLSIPKNCELTAPVHLLFLNTENNLRTTVHNTVLAAANSQCVLVEEHVADNAEQYAAQITTELHAEDNAKLHYYKIQHENITATHHANIHIQQQQDSCVRAFLLTLGSREARDELRVKLLARGAECHLRGLYQLQQDKQDVQHHVHVDHLASLTTSAMLFKGILDKQSRAAFIGKVFVHQDAQQINAHQANHNLLLSKTAEVTTKPELEIYADDVKCTHGATVGQLDQESLFYLRSRGIDEKTAFHMLTQAFADEVMNHIEHPAIKAYVQQWINL